MGGDGNLLSSILFWLLSTASMLLLVVMIFGLFALWDALPRWRHRRAVEKRIVALLAGRDKAAILAQAPYEFFYSQGDDVPRLGNRVTGERYADYVSSELEAELWIIERYLADNSAESAPHSNR